MYDDDDVRSMVICGTGFADLIISGYFLLNAFPSATSRLEEARFHTCSKLTNQVVAAWQALKRSQLQILSLYSVVAAALCGCNMIYDTDLVQLRAELPDS